MAECSTDGCKRQARRGTKICKVCYTKQWHERQGKCRLDHCPRRIDAAELCTTHYNRKRRGLPDWDKPVPLRMPRGGKCQHADGCDEPAYSLGLCRLHWQRQHRTGEIGPVGLLKAAKGKGTLDPRGYRVITVGGQRYLEHRWVMEQQLGRPLWPDEEVHHRNRIRDDNRPENLELWATPQPRGGRVEDLVRFYVERYPAEARRALARLEG